MLLGMTALTRRMQYSIWAQSENNKRKSHMCGFLYKKKKMIRDVVLAQHGECMKRIA